MKKNKDDEKKELKFRPKLFQMFDISEIILIICCVTVIILNVTSIIIAAVSQEPYVSSRQFIASAFSTICWTITSLLLIIRK